MQKRILSIILSLSIVASLFAGMTFSASAESLAHTLYKSKGNTTKDLLEKQGIYAEQSLIRDAGAKQTNVYYYVSDTTSTENKAFADVSDLVTGKATEIGKNANLDSATATDYPTTDIYVTDTAAYNNRFFVTYEDGYTSSSVPTALVDNEEKQFLQINYELPAEADISALAVAATNAFNTWFAMKHYKWIFADTEKGLWTSEDYVEVKFDEGDNESVSAVKLTTPKRAKWVALRIICGYTTKPTIDLSRIYVRTRHISIQGTYVNPASIDGVSAVAENDNGESEATAVATLAGNTDKNGAYPSTTVALTAKESYKGSNSKIYTFDGWYLGEDKIAEKATANYTLTGAETTKEFTAKYTVKDYELFTDVTVSGYNTEDTIVPGTGSLPMDKSLIVGKQPISTKIFNKIEGDGFATSDEPQDFTAAQGLNLNSNVTSASVWNSDATLYNDGDMKKYMFVETDENGKFVDPYVTNDETKQWIQINYELDATATIDNVVFGRVVDNAWNRSKWDPSHFKVILSDTEEGLLNLGAAKAVVDVDVTDNTSLNTCSYFDVKLNSAVTAKYVAIRIIAMYNNRWGGWEGNATATTVYPRFTHLGVHGTYEEPVNKVATVTATTEDKALEDLVSVSDVAYGNADKNDAYAKAEVTVKAEATYSDDDHDYTFAGWFLNEEPYTEDAEFVYDATKDDANFVAKYEKQVKIIYHTVSVWWWGTNHVGDYQVAHDEVFDISIAIEDAKAKWPERFTDGKRIVFDEYKNTPITANTTIQGRQDNRARFFEKDGKTMIGEEIWFNALGGKPIAPAAPAVEGYTFTGWDKEINSETRDYVAQYEINKYTVTYVFEGEEVGTETVEYNKTATLPAVAGKEGYNVVWNYNDAAIVEDTTITGGYQIKTFTVKFFVEGELVDTQYVDWNTAAKAPEVDAKYGYDFAWDKDFDKVTTDLDVNGAYTAKANNCTIKFESVTGKLLGEVIVEQGDVPSNVPEVLAQIKAINTKVEAVYGYTVKLNEAGDVFWSNEVYDEAIITEVSVRPEYIADETVTTNVYVEDVDGTELIKESARYDSAITLASKQGAEYWADGKDENANVLIGEPTGTLYACGGAMEIYAKTGEFEAPAVAIVGKINDGNFLVFAHVNVENATECGVIFASSTAYGKKADFDLDDAAADKEKVDAGEKAQPSYTVIKIDATNVSDFMAPLTNTGDKTRYARAYVKVGENYIYTTAICNK